jgi:hypothetical protein
MNMAKRVYFAFHYQDVIDFRANVVRNHWCTKPDREDAGFYDASIWEEAKKKGDTGLKRLINGGLDNTSNTCVLIGSSTYARPWVRYGPNPLEYVGVTYSGDGQTATLWEKVNGTWVKYDKIDGTADYSTNVSEPYRNQGYNLGNWYKTYDWNSNNGFDNFATWLK